MRIIRECPTGVCMKHVGYFFFKQATEINPWNVVRRPSYVIFVFSEIVLQHNSRTLAACNSEMSAAVITWVLRAPLPVPTAHEQWAPTSPTCVLFPGDYWWRVTWPLCESLLCLRFLRVQDSVPFVGPCLEMSHVLRACPVLIISSCVCDWCLPA